MPRLVRPVVLALALAAAASACTRRTAADPGAARAAAEGTIVLAERLAAGGLRTVGRTAVPLADGGRTVVRLEGVDSSLQVPGMAWLDDVTLADGTIDVELRGRNAPAASFVGVAFHGASDSTYEAVYVRPFNFRHADSASRAHAVQYVSHPAHTWSRLRASQPGRYEAAIDPAPDPDAWLRLRIVVAEPRDTVYVNGADRPSLVVRRLGELRSGRVGLWVGNPSTGDFATLRVVPARD